jgi:hypothetical protein
MTIIHKYNLSPLTGVEYGSGCGGCANREAGGGTPIAPTPVVSSSLLPAGPAQFSPQYYNNAKKRYVIINERRIKKE